MQLFTRKPVDCVASVLLQMQILQLFYSIERNKISQLKLSIYYIDRYFAFNKISLTAKYSCNNIIAVIIRS